MALKTAWPHAPSHKLAESGTYFVTASTYQKAHYFRGDERITVLHRGLLSVANEYGWQLEAWAVFSNHYHFVGHSPADSPSAASLSAMLACLHSKTGKWLNRLDATACRKVWHNFRDSHLTYQRSYLARLNYVHQNPVKHGLVPVANRYPWCSARWFEHHASRAQINMIYATKIDTVKVYDDFDVDGFEQIMLRGTEKRTHS